MAGLNNWITVNKNFCSFDFTNLKIKSKKDSIDDAVNQLLKKNKKIFVSLSGGIDSEFAASCLQERGVDFVPIIIDLSSNENELWYAYKWCYDNKKKPLAVNLTQKEVVESFAHISKTKNIPFYASIDVLILDYVLKRNGLLITGNENLLNKSYIFQNENFEKLSKNLTSHDFAFLSEILGGESAIGFLTCTPDLLYNFLSEVDYEKPSELAIAEYFDVQPRQKLNANKNLMSFPLLWQMRKLCDEGKFVSHFAIGNKDSFLKRALNKEVIKIDATPIEFL
jgi:hypothetical protein